MFDLQMWELEKYNSWPSILSTFNNSLTSGSVPAYFKSALAETLLKKNNLDPSILNNYRHVSKLPFISKILEKIVFNQLVTHQKANYLKSFSLSIIQ